MHNEPSRPNIKKAVPFFGVSSMDASLRLYIDGLGFTMIEKWIPHEKIEWCWLQRGDVAIMLQEYREGFKPEGKLGAGMSVCFICEDALAYYHEVLARNVAAKEPFVGNHAWVFEVIDPDGYRLNFESPTDVPEETRYTEWKR